MLVSEMILKYRVAAVAGTLAIVGCVTTVTSMVVAQDAPARVATEGEKAEY
jgi:hypothetical protein